MRTRRNSGFSGSDHDIGVSHGATRTSTRRKKPEYDGGDDDDRVLEHNEHEEDVNTEDDATIAAADVDKSYVDWMKEQMAAMVKNASKGASKGQVSETSHRKRGGNRTDGYHGNAEHHTRSRKNASQRKNRRSEDAEDSHGWEAESERSDDAQNGAPDHSEGDSADHSQHSPESGEVSRTSGGGRQWRNMDKRTKQYKQLQASGDDGRTRSDRRTPRGDRDMRREREKERMIDLVSPRKQKPSRSYTYEETSGRTARELQIEEQNKRKRGRPRKEESNATSGYGRSPAADSDAFVRRSSRAKRQRYDNLNDRILKISNGVYEDGAHSDDGADKPDSDDDDDGSDHTNDNDSDEQAPDSDDNADAQQNEDQSGGEAQEESHSEEEETIDANDDRLYTRRRSSSRLIARSTLIQEQQSNSRENRQQAGEVRRGRKPGRPSWRQTQHTRTRTHTRTHTHADDNDSTSEEEGDGQDEAHDDTEDSEEEEEDNHSRQHLRNTRRPGLRARVAKRQNPYDRYMATRSSPQNKTKSHSQRIRRERERLEEPTPERQPKKYILAKAKEEGKTNLGPSNRRYFFRNTIPAVQRFKPPTPKSASKGPNRQTILFNDPRPARGRDGRSNGNRRRKQASNYDFSGSSGDEDRNFEAAHKRSVMRARKEFLPMNMTSEEMEETARARGRHNTSALADIEPMEFDKEVGFTDIGGLDKTIDTLKEMVIFPLLYPEFYDHFKVKSARGILLHGPPGTGKTLVARALANECTRVGGQKVAFFMRKGSDCLSKWVGESERQLRLLFDQAYLLRPSVIFFDEIDGLAPIRSTRQDQIHSSIVSTLLALMDGLDDRGQVIVIGATNRLDAIDPALRRPGRFDREFLFARPNQQTRAEILKIHTKGWDPPLDNETLLHLAQSTAGYCGADLKALVASSAVHSLKSRYPQIYQSNSKLQIDVESLQIDKTCFNKAMKDIQPSANRSNEAHARATPNDLRPLLSDLVQSIHKQVKEAQLPIAVHAGHPLWSAVVDRTNRRLLITGTEGMGQTKYLAPAVMYELEIEPIYNLGIQSLLSIGGAGAGTYATPEEACINTFREAYRAKQAVLYIPNINRWWEWATPVLKQVFMTMLRDAPPASKLFVVATCDEGPHAVPYECTELFGSHQEVVVAPLSTREPFVAYFADLKEISQAPVYLDGYQAGAYDALPLAEVPQKNATDVVGDVQLDQAERKRMERRVQWVQRELRIVLRVFTEKLLKERAFHAFWHPVDTELNPDYLKKISTPMDLSTLLQEVDNRKYATPNCWIKDIDVIVANCKQYLSGTEPVLRRAFALEDRAYGMVDELDDDFVKLCEDTHKLAQQLGPVLQRAKSGSNMLTSTTSQPHHPTPPGAARVSLRKRGIEPEIAVDDALSLMKATSRSESKTRLAVSESPEPTDTQDPPHTAPSHEDSEHNAGVNDDQSEAVDKDIHQSDVVGENKTQSDEAVDRTEHSDQSDVADDKTDHSDNEDMPTAVLDTAASDQVKPKQVKMPSIDFEAALRKLTLDIQARKARAKSGSEPNSAIPSVRVSRLQSHHSVTKETEQKTPFDSNGKSDKPSSQKLSPTQTIANAQDQSATHVIAITTSEEDANDTEAENGIDTSGGDGERATAANTDTTHRGDGVVQADGNDLTDSKTTDNDANGTDKESTQKSERPCNTEKEKHDDSSHDSVASTDRASAVDAEKAITDTAVAMETTQSNDSGINTDQTKTSKQDNSKHIERHSVSTEAAPRMNGDVEAQTQQTDNDNTTGHDGDDAEGTTSEKPLLNTVAKEAEEGTEASREFVSELTRGLDMEIDAASDADEVSGDVLQSLHYEDWEDWEMLDTPVLLVDAEEVDRFFDAVVDACLGQPTLKVERLRAALIRTIGGYIQEFDRQNMVNDLTICLRDALH